MSQDAVAWRYEFSSEYMTRWEKTLTFDHPTDVFKDHPDVEIRNVTPLVVRE